MSKRVARYVLLVAVCLFCVSTLTAQVNPTGTLTGTVTDPSTPPAAIVGAAVTVKDDATGAKFETKSGSDGRFTVGNLTPGVYTVTVTMPGFKTGVFKNVKIIIGETYDLGARLELGEVSSTVIVEAGQEVMETQSTSVGTSITGKAITSLPFTSRDALDLAILVPGAQTTGRPRQTSFDGLPKGSINITYDGINVQDSVLKSNDGFFTLIRPRVDAVEEFSISTAAQGANESGEGAVQIRFETKRGGNAFHGGVWEYHRNDYVNSNYYFNNLSGQPRQVVRLNEFGYKIGGPVLKDRLFFFTDFDFYRNPQSNARTRTILTGAASQGLFTYAVSAVPGTLPAWVTCDATAKTCTANLLQMAANFGATSTIDSVVGGLLTAMNSAVSAPGVTLGTPPSLFQRSISFNNPGVSNRYFPDLRADWNITKNNIVTFTYHYSKFNSAPDFLNGFDQTFPVAPFNKNQGSQVSNRNLFVGSWRTNIGSNKSNEVRLGVQSSPVNFFPDLNISLYPTANTNLGSTHINPQLNLVSQPLLDWITQGRNGALGQLVDTFSWTKGAHTMSFGVSWTEQRYNDFAADEAVAPVTLGVDSSDPMSGNFGTSTLPGSAAADRGNAALLYGMLAGRVTGFGTNVYFDASARQFKPGSNLITRVHQREVGLFAADAWRWRPSLTLNYGLRWEYQGAPVDTLNEFFRVRGDFGGLYGVSGANNLFKPGTLTGTAPVFDLNGGKKWWNSQWHNFAPSVGVAWQPNFENIRGLNKVFGGRGKTVLRAGYSVTFTREGLNNFFTIAEGNPGFSGAESFNPVGSSTCNPTCPAGTFVAGNVQLQSLNFGNVLQSPSSFTTTFPIDPTAGQSVNLFDPNLKIPMVQSWSIGVQRELTPNMVMEVRYVGNHATRLWRQININEVNIFENGFLKEFQNAQNNLAICRANAAACLTAAGESVTDQTKNANRYYSNLGLPGQVPVPILTGAFTGSQTGSQKGSNFRSGARISQLDNGLAGSFANTLSGSLTFWNNIQAAGFPRNFWVANPDSRGGAFFFFNGTQSTYNALQVELRRRPAHGLQFNANYTYSKSLNNYFANSSISFANFDTLRNPGRNKGPAPFDLRHAFKMQAIYELPFGPGRRWTTQYAFLNKLIEGWEFNSITRWQSGRVTQITGGLGGTFNQIDGGVILTGLTPGQLQSLLDVRKTPTPAPGAVFYFPDSLLDANRQRANSAFLKACNTPGAFCPRVFVYGPNFFRADWSAAKHTRITERVEFEIRAEFLNAFNNANFFYGGSAAATPTTRSLQSTAFGRITDAYQDISTTDDPGGRIIQLVFRINF